VLQYALEQQRVLPDAPIPVAEVAPPHTAQRLGRIR
jgi:hypothetical protein